MGAASLSSRSTSKPPARIAGRIAACTQRMCRQRVDGYLVTSRIDQFYLTGFDGEDGAALILPDRVCLLTDGRFKYDVAEAAPWARAVIRTNSLNEAVAGLIRRRRIERLGIQPEVLSVQAQASLRKAVRPARLVPMPPVVADLRLIKDESEVRAIEKAVQVAEAAFRAVVRRIRPGMTERDLAARLQYELLRCGASGPSFPVIVAEGANAAFPHARPGDRRLREGSAVLIDWGATVGNYRSDLTRVVFVRRIRPRIRRMYENVLEAQLAAIEAVGPGVRMSDVDAQARNLLKRRGMGRQFLHSLGHGIGLDIHEPPRLSSRARDSLQPGMVVTVEPGVYFEGAGGVRIEDDVLVTPTGYRVLSSLPKDPEAMVV
jgi:Xaa-Pro aminopeptidase